MSDNCYTRDFLIFNQNEKHQKFYVNIVNDNFLYIYKNNIFTFHEKRKDGIIRLRCNYNNRKCKGRLYLDPKNYKLKLELSKSHPIHPPTCPNGKMLQMIEKCMINLQIDKTRGGRELHHEIIYNTKMLNHLHRYIC